MGEDELDSEELGGDSITMEEDNLARGIPNPAALHTPKPNDRKRRAERAASGGDGREKRTKVGAFASPWAYTRKSMA